MAEKKWNDKLRRKMEDYTQTPPEGLWEGIEAGLPAPRTAFPWMWALAGVAAVLLAVVLIWRPTETDSPAVAEVTTEEVIVSPEMLTTDPAPVESEVVSSRRKAAAEAIAEVAPAVTPAETAEDSSEESQAEPAAEPADAEITAPETNPVDVKPAEKAAEDSGAVVAPSPITPGKNDPVYSAEKNVIRRKPVVSGSLLAGGIPGTAATSYTSFATNAPTGRGGGRMPTAALLSRNKPNQTETNYSVAMRVGAMFNLSFSPHWGIESGLQLTNLQAQTKSVTGNVTTLTDKTISYIGIPLLAVYTPLRLDRFSLYTSAGPMFEYGFRSFGTVDSYIGDEQVGSEKIGDKESDAIFSVGLNIGVQWQLADFGGLFVQPGVSWHLAGEGNTESFYTKHPLAFSLAAGFRFTF